MSSFNDKPISEGTRKKTEYENEQKSRLALNIGRTDGGKLLIPIMVDAKTTQEEEKYQHNTLLAVTPLARLPGYDKLNETLQGALPRPGRIYVFLKNKLWRELETDGKGQLSDVDVAHWRKIAEKKGDADKREPVGVKQYLILVPMFLQGRFVGDQLSMAYSELPWTWEYIEWLEKDSGRIKARSQNMAPTWAATAGETKHWKASLIYPATPVKGLVKGLRARDFNIESALEDPADFTPALAAFKPDALILKLQQRKQDLAVKLKLPTPTALPNLEAGEDVLAQNKLRDYPHLVGMILDDPLFALRHTTAQIRDCVDYLQTLNALVPHEPHGRYAQVLYSTLAGPLAKLSDEVDLPKLQKAVFEEARENSREKLAKLLSTLVDLLDKKLQPVLLDWSYSRNEALLEPYSLLNEALDALNQVPNRSDAMYTGKGYPELTGAINRLVQGLLQGKHPLGALLLAKTADQLPDLVKRLKTLADSGQEPKPEAMGLSTLMLTASLTGEVDNPSAGKGFAYFLADLLDNFGASVVAQIGRLSQDASKIQLDRLFSPTFVTLTALSPKMAEIKLMPRGQALAQNYVVIGVEGAGLRGGLTDVERQALTRKSYRYATLHDQSGTAVGSTSPRGSGAGRPTLRDVTVIAIPKGNADLAKYSDFRVRFGAVTETMEKNKAVPTLMVAFAAYNLWVQIKAFNDLRAGGEWARGIVGEISASLDLLAALGSHSKLLFGVTFEHQLTKPRFNVEKISTRWAKNLKVQTGSPNLPLLRTLGGVATLGGAILSGWDSYRSLNQGDTDAAAAYGVAAVGSGLWAAYGFGLIINPYALVAGVVLTIGGTIAANLFTDSDIEIVVKKGPFGLQFAEAGMLDQALGNGQRFAHLKNPQIAYQQLIGSIGKPQIFVQRLADWRKKALPAHIEALQKADVARAPLQDSRMQCNIPGKQPLVDYDWAIVLSSPLLSMFENDRQFQLVAEEFQSRLRTDVAFDIKRYEPVPVAAPKLSALSLDATSVLYVLPSSLRVAQRSPLERQSMRMTQGLKVSAQFVLSADEANDLLVLPQPSPKSWSAFTPANRRLPPIHQSPNDAPPYWQIEITEFFV
ncbi:hypothetical protein [Pseudomonas arsenicoxydans]|uniref:Uncharacterized protein n=1 Tax=Pseudomonas arsenicoxydans TaxID=702115 RepID=A0A4P6FYP1_9PSED|nr:hypothetical protein [Pseudomonas arsenicoxydans]QAY83358.1 hypothetical protein CUN61_04960 [Pseudomonas arsenicoxydans]